MKWPWKRNAEKRAELEQTEQYLDAAQARVTAQAPRVNMLAAWAESRRMSNGFGEDFEWTLAHPRRARG